MANQSPDATTASRIETLLPLTSLQSRTASIFILGGLLLVASVVGPVGLDPITDWSWVAGLVLVGLGVVTIVLGLLGLYPRVHGQAPWAARMGALCATIAGGAALGLIAMVGAAGLASITPDISQPTPMGLFVAIALSMAGGLALGYVSFGVARLQADGRSNTTGRLLVAGGGLLLVPVFGELLRAGIGIGPPPWILFPALGVLIIDTLAVGYQIWAEPAPAR